MYIQYLRQGLSAGLTHALIGLVPVLRELVQCGPELVLRQCEHHLQVRADQCALVLGIALQSAQPLAVKLLQLSTAVSHVIALTPVSGALTSRAEKSAGALTLTSSAGLGSTRVIIGT